MSGNTRPPPAGRPSESVGGPPQNFGNTDCQIPATTTTTTTTTTLQQPAWQLPPSIPYGYPPAPYCYHWPPPYVMFPSVFPGPPFQYGHPSYQSPDSFRAPPWMVQTAPCTMGQPFTAPYMAPPQVLSCASWMSSVNSSVAFGDFISSKAESNVANSVCPLTTRM